MKELTCDGCRKHMGKIRDAKLRKGLTVYCHECDRDIKKALATIKAMQYMGSNEYSKAEWES